MSRLKLKLPVILLSLLAVSNSRAGDFSKQGSAWLGGGVSYSSLGFGEGPRMNMVELSPILRFFPVDHLMVGPSFTWTGMFIESESIHEFGMGADLGVVFNENDHLYPYLRSGGRFTIYGGSGLYESQTGFTLPIAAGMIVPVGNIFAIQIEPAFTITWIEGENMNVFGVNLGICGIGEKAAVSFLQRMSGIMSFF